jgi:hypothetical protein
VEKVESAIGDDPSKYAELEETMSREELLELNKAVLEYGGKVNIRHMNVLVVKLT